MGKFAENFKLIWQGKCTRNQMLTYFSNVFAVFVIGMLWGMAKYPGGFSFFNVFVSYLGGNEVNPEGYIFYNITVVFAGLMSLPHFIYVYRKTAPTLKPITFLGCFSGILGFLGFAALGIWYEGASFIGHQWATIFAFGGFGLSALLLLFPLIRRAYLKFNWPKPWALAITYIIIFGALGYSALYQDFSVLLVTWRVDPTETIWEWLYFFVAVFWLFDILLLTDNQKME